jgi:2-hydroxychromene-2-carboxylate isomerase
VDATDASAGHCFAREKGVERLYRNAVFVAGWGEGLNISDRTVLAACAEKAGLARDEFLAALTAERYRAEVQNALQACIEDRVFGVPTLVVNGKRFWGNDRLEVAIEELRRA